MSAEPERRSSTFVPYTAAGNRFALLDLAREPTPPEPAELARELCAGKWARPAGFRPDGLLLFTRQLAPRGGQSTFGMLLYNADGSRPEACGNGLRVIGDHALRAGYAEPGMVWVETDAGLRRLALSRGPQGEPRVRALVAHPRIIGREVLIVHAGREHRATLVDAGNPHCVLFVDDPEREELDALGRALQSDRRFPSGVNVELVARGASGLVMRVYERGVGETLSCGTGACAAAFAALASERVEPGPVLLRCRGGELLVERDGEGGAWLSGPVEPLA